MSDLKRFQLAWFFLAFSLFSAIVISQATLPGDWAGYVTINSSRAQDGAVVGAVANNNTTVVISTTVGAVQTGTGYYLIHVPGNTGDTITFKICGVSAGISSQTWSVGPHPNSTANSPYINLSISTLADGSACTYACGCSGGYCNSGTCASSQATTTTTSGGGGGGGASTTVGGGGGGGGPAGGGATTTTAAPLIQEVEFITNISANSSATVTINNSDSLKIEQITIQTNDNVNNVQLTVQETTQPANANLVISSDVGAVYKYLEITKTNINDSDIASVKIKFKVEKSWLTSNNIDKNTVTLNRLVGNNWVKLPTTITSEDSTFVYFEATSPGLSTFAIAGNKIVSATTVPPTTSSTAPVVPPTGQPFNMNLLWAVLIILVLAFVFFFWHFKKKKQNSGHSSSQQSDSSEDHPENSSSGPFHEPVGPTPSYTFLR